MTQKDKSKFSDLIWILKEFQWPPKKKLFFMYHFFGGFHKCTSLVLAWESAKDKIQLKHCNNSTVALGKQMISSDPCKFNKYSKIKVPQLGFGALLCVVLPNPTYLRCLFAVCFTQIKTC